jgi:hypothetical protein
MPTRHLLVCSCLCAALGCAELPLDDQSEDLAAVEAAELGRIPRGPLPPLEYTLALTYDDGPFLPRPNTITGHLYLEVLANRRVRGTISAREASTVSLAAVAGRIQDHDIVLEAGAVGVTPGGQLEFDELTIQLRDDDGDGRVDHASAQASGTFIRVINDAIDFSGHTSVLRAALDTTATTASLVAPRGVPPLLPYDTVGIVFAEPLRDRDVRRRVRVLAGGRPIAGQLSTQPTGGLATEAVFQPDGFLPFAADITVDVGRLIDPSGNRLTQSTARIPVVADPGRVAQNPGFESGLDRWISLGAEAAGSFEGFAPVEGAGQAVVRQQRTLAGVLDVGPSASELELAVTVLAEGREVDADRTAVIALRRAGGESIEVFDVADVRDLLEACTTCTEFGTFVGPLRRTVDVTALRGQRVFLTVDVRSSFFFGVNFFAALVDDIQLR